MKKKTKAKSRSEKQPPELAYPLDFEKVMKGILFYLFHL